MGTHPIFESDFDCLTDSEKARARCSKRIRVKKKLVSSIYVGMTSLANITRILLLLNIVFEVESKRIHIDFIGCYKRPDVVALGDSSTNRLYYPIYRNKRMPCPCHQKQWCRFELELRGSGRRARVITEDVLDNDRRNIEENDT